MKLQGTQMTVKHILFESNDTEVLVKGNITKGVMNYDSDIIVSHSQLNIIFNLLQKQNSDITVHDFLTTERMYNDETLFSADFSQLTNSKIELFDLSGDQTLKQIRA